MRYSSFGARRGDDRCPEIGASWKVQSLRHHTDDRVRYAIIVCQDPSPEYVGVTAEPLLPGTVAQHHHGCCAEDVVRRVQRSAKQGSRAKHLEERARHEGAGEARDLAAVLDWLWRSAIVGEEGHRLERSGSSGELTGVIEAKGVGESLVARFTPQHDKAILVLDGQPAQE